MKFEVTDSPVYEDGGRWRKVYLALLKAHKRKKSIRVYCEGKHFGTVTHAVKAQLKADKKNVKRICIGCSRDKERDAVVLTIYRIDKHGRALYA